MAIDIDQEFEDIRERLNQRADRLELEAIYRLDPERLGREVEEVYAAVRAALIAAAETLSSIFHDIAETFRGWEPDDMPITKGNEQ